MAPSGSRFDPSSSFASSDISKDRWSYCPVCRYGNLDEIVLMDAVSCNFCRHIFSVNAAQSILTLEDTVQPARWYWTGQRWAQHFQSDPPQRLWLWGLVTFLVLLPTTLVWVPSQLFPPAPDTAWAVFPVLWTFFTFACHGGLALWLLSEHYQWPLYVRVRILLQQLFARA